MINYILYFVLFLVVIYMGEVLGLLIQCENCNELRKVSRKVFYVPFLGVALLFAYIKESCEKRDMHSLIEYILFEEKHLFMLFIMAKYFETASKKELQRKRISKNLSQNQTKSHMVTPSIVRAIRIQFTAFM